MARAGPRVRHRRRSPWVACLQPFRSPVCPCVRRRALPGLGRSAGLGLCRICGGPLEGHRRAMAVLRTQGQVKLRSRTQAGHPCLLPSSAGARACPCHPGCGLLADRTIIFSRGPYEQRISSINSCDEANRTRPASTSASESRILDSATVLIVERWVIPSAPKTESCEIVLGELVFAAFIAIPLSAPS